MGKLHNLHMRIGLLLMICVLTAGCSPVSEGESSQISESEENSQESMTISPPLQRNRKRIRFRPPLPPKRHPRRRKLLPLSRRRTWCWPKRKTIPNTTPMMMNHWLTNIFRGYP